MMNTKGSGGFLYWIGERRKDEVRGKASKRHGYVGWEGWKAGGR